MVRFAVCPLLQEAVLRLLPKALRARGLQVDILQDDVCKEGRDALAVWVSDPAIYRSQQTPKRENAAHMSTSYAQTPNAAGIQLTFRQRQEKSTCTPYRIQNPSEPQNAPQILARNQDTKKLRKIYENPRFSYISRFWFRERIRGVFWGSEGFCIL